MTIALCLSCGAMRFGAFGQCEYCHEVATENEELNISFTDWFCSNDELEYFGSLIKEINKHCNDKKLRYWSFVIYLSENLPDMLSIDNLGSEIELSARQVLSCCTFKVKQKEL